MEIGTELLMVGRVSLAALLGAVIGYQRERAGKAAGLRTMILICLGSSLFTVASTYAFNAQADPSRVAANIVTGIGFLGAGSILHPTNGIVAGLTTAATIWVTAAVGMAAGLGMYLIAVISTVIVLAVLFMPRHIR